MRRALVRAARPVTPIKRTQLDRAVRTEFVKGSRMPAVEDRGDVHRRQASEKPQGRKPRAGIAELVRRALWGFDSRGCHVEGHDGDRTRQVTVRERAMLQGWEVLTAVAGDNLALWSRSGRAPSLAIKVAPRRECEEHDRCAGIMTCRPGLAWLAGSRARRPR
jgi:hypothetical protein